MSTFIFKEEYLTEGFVYDEKSGLEIDEPFFVTFVRLWKDKTWDKHKVRVPFPLSHEKCTNQDLSFWYEKVYGNVYFDLKYVFAVAE
jgi:lysophospholipid acyltransferase (LPLAT)-like uncharacterized protein